MPEESLFFPDGATYCGVLTAPYAAYAAFTATDLVEYGEARDRVRPAELERWLLAAGLARRNGGAELVPTAGRTRSSPRIDLIR